MTVKEIADFLYKIIPEKYLMQDYHYNSYDDYRAEINTTLTPEYITYVYNSLRILNIPTSTAKARYSSNTAVTASIVIHTMLCVANVTLWISDNTSETIIL